MTNSQTEPENLAGTFWHRSVPIADALPLLEDRADPESLTLLADNIPILCWIARGDGYIMWYNRRWHDYCGTTPEAMAGWGWQSVHDPNELPRVLERWSASIAAGKPFEMVFPLRGADGIFRPFLTRIAPLRDASGRVVRWFGCNTEIDAQMRAEAAAKSASDLSEVLTRELSHRIKNIFAIISSLVRLSLRREPAAGAFARDLLERIRALGRAHEFARPHSEQSLPFVAEGMLHGFLREIFRPYAVDGVDVISLSGLDVAIDDKGATPLALLFHELATNAVKYGALSSADGRVAIEIATSGEDQMVILWIERGGPLLAGAPAESGFGTRLAAISVEQQLGGVIEREWLKQGLLVRVRIKPSRLARGQVPERSL